jgi:hypothetical protein
MPLGGLRIIPHISGPAIIKCAKDLELLGRSDRWPKLDRPDGTAQVF